jgi:lipopolysaccharide export system permease protein
MIFFIYILAKIRFISLTIIRITTLIINRYLIAEIIKPLASMLVVLVIIFAAYSTNRYFADAISGLMSIKTIIILILLKIVIALEVVLPASLYLAVIVGLGRLYNDNEMTALFASGVALRRVLAVVLVFSLPVALLGGSFSLAVRPWAYEQFFWLKAKAKAEFDVSRLQAGKFYKIGEGNRVIFIEKIDRARQRAEGVFLQKDQKGENDMLEVLYAKEAYQRLDPATGRQVIRFLGVCFYEFPRTGEWSGRAMESSQYTLSLWPQEIMPVEYKTKAASTFHLARSDNPSDIAELQGRVSVPLATILLALLGVPLSRIEPRKGKHTNLPIAIVIYGFYNSIVTVAKLGVEQSRIPPLLGIWWVQVLLAGALFILLRNPSQQCWYPRRGR